MQQAAFLAESQRSTSEFWEHIEKEPGRTTIISEHSTQSMNASPNMATLPKA